MNVFTWHLEGRHCIHILARGLEFFSYFKYEWPDHVYKKDDFSEFVWLAIKLTRMRYLFISCVKIEAFMVGLKLKEKKDFQLNLSPMAF